MAPKKNPKQSRKPQCSSSSSSALRLQISAENENRLRRLLLNSVRPTIATDDTLTKGQKAKKLKAIYEKLSCEGFTNHHIELALSALKEGATFESALDWLCLNLPGNELPLKFSSGTSFHYNEGGSVCVISNQQENSAPSLDPSITTKDEAVESPVLIKRHLNDDTLNSFQPSQADWIRQYVEQQEEDESKTWEDDILDGTSATNKPCEPRSYDVIAKEYCAARLEAVKAKGKGDKKHQEQAGHIIRKLKQELSALGLSDDNLGIEYEHEISSNSASERASTGHEPFDCFKEKTPSDAEGFILPSDGTSVNASDVEHHSMDENLAKSCSPVVDKGNDSAEGDVGDVELGGFFLEDVPSNEILPPDILKLQKQEKIKRLSEKKNLDKLDGIWKKGDPQKSPKAVLHQLCQKSGWEAPKFNKILGRGKSFSYTISILRKASGRGKNRKAGGLVTLQLPDQNETFESAEDAQNKVAAYALFQLFPDIPVHLPITEPYASVVIKWMEGESLTRLEDSEEDHRSRFVDSLLIGDGSGATAPIDVTDHKFPQNDGRLHENRSATLTSHQPFSQRETYIKEKESTDLRQLQNIKMRTQRYQDILKFRATLPIAALKADILKLLKENDVLVVCGETGSGKTTQVPQFILDDMIESGHGGHCNIVCTQPRRIAAISVAERVADERCEPSPGSDGSLIGYQVRLESARNEQTRLLFCTTGILLRKLMVYMFAEWYKSGCCLEYPLHGTAAIVDALVRGLEKFGGRISLQSHVENIVVENDRAIGVKLRRGQFIRARKAVVSNASMWDTLKLLPKEVVPKSYSDRINTTPQCESFMHLHLGFDAEGIRSDLGIHHIIVNDWKRGVDADQNVVLISVPSVLSPDLAPPGKHVLHAYLPGTEPFELWEGLDHRSAEYRNLKAERSEVMWRAVERALGPGFNREKCEVKLIGSPLTHQKFLRRNRGTYGPAVQAGTDTFPGHSTPIPQLYCCGDSTFPGIGVPAVAASGAIVANSLVSVSQHSELLDAIGI